MITKKGTVVHERKFMGDGDLQVDEFTIKIPVDCLSNKGIGKLQHWCVEELDRAYIDWSKGVFVLEYITEHYLPEGYEHEEVYEEVV